MGEFDQVGRLPRNHRRQEAADESAQHDNQADCLAALLWPCIGAAWRTTIDREMELLAAKETDPTRSDEMAGDAVLRCLKTTRVTDVPRIA